MQLVYLRREKEAVARKTDALADLLKETRVSLQNNLHSVVSTGLSRPLFVIFLFPNFITSLWIYFTCWSQELSGTLPALSCIARDHKHADQSSPIRE